MVRRTLTGVLIMASLTTLLWLSLQWLGTINREPGVIGSVETVRLRGPSGEAVVVAKIDTGADFTSVDQALAESLGYRPNFSDTRRIVTDQGAVERPTIIVTYMLGNREIISVATVADRSALSNQVLIGKNDLQGFTVDVSREFLTHPGQTSSGLMRFLSLTNVVFSSGLSRIIIMVPILGAIVVVSRLIFGIRTYGIFAPTIIAVTLLELGIFPGLIIYVFLVAVGITATVMILDRLPLAHIAELSIVMFILVLLVTVVTALPTAIPITFGAAFFPLIITTHLIEQASRSIEEHNLREGLGLLISTLIMALVLAILGLLLVRQSLAVLWTVFGAAMLASLLAGNYLGLRVTELIRFKFLRRTHVHK